jgi:penicillin-binding protein 1B
MNGRKSRKPFLPGTWLRKPAFKILLSVFLFVCIIFSGVTLYYYQYYSRMIDRRLSGEVFQRTARLYATPARIYPGQKLTPDAVVARLQRAGYEPEGSNHSGEGTYALSRGRVTITPLVGGAAEAMQLTFQGGHLNGIVKKGKGELAEAALPAELVTSFGDANRQKRRIVQFMELPPHLVNALIAAEDNRFYSHFGIDPIRLTGAVFQSFRNSNRIRGTSTITQQFSRNFFLTTERTATRKANEMFLSLLLEQRLSKEQILTLYANDVYLGARGSYSIKGFGEAAAAYFGKDLTALTLTEAATLAAIIPAPSGMYSPVKHPDQAKERRNMVLDNMVGLGFIKAEEAKKAKATELKLAPFKNDASDAPYLVDYIRESLLKDFSEDALNNDSLRVETTIDAGLQKVAVDAVVKGLKDVNEVIAQRNKRRKPDAQLPAAQAALIVLDRKTAGIRAMVGGGDYGYSQLNRITDAFRQPGSIFKPWVYAAAFEECEKLITAPNVENAESADPEHVPAPGDRKDCITPATVFDDVATTFIYDGDRTYEPNNYQQKFKDRVTVRYALEHSLNIPTVKIAEAIGYEKVANLARKAGLNAKIKAYPSVALGAFEVTPLEMAGSYTVFANEGRHLPPHGLTKVIAADGSLLKTYEYKETQVLSPQVTYLMTNIMEGVIRSGTGAGVRARGFSLPAAGKTGTSRDGWFAGYTKDYIAIAWVGFDDNSDLNIEGARSALPIWTDFMLKAQELHPPRDPDAMYFAAPDGIVEEEIPSDAHEPPAWGCAQDHREMFLAGSVPDPLACGEPHSNAVSDLVKKGGNVVGRIGRFFGGLFGGGKDEEEEEKKEKESEPTRR